MKEQKKRKRLTESPEIVAHVQALREATAVARGERNAKYMDEKAPLQLGTSTSADRFAGKDGHRERFVITLQDGSTSEQWLAVPKDSKRCTAKTRKGPYRGYRCRKPRLLGATVCQQHGAQLPHVREAARSRLLAYSDLAVQEMINIARSKNEETSDRIRALNSILDRAGVDGKQTITLEVKPWQEALSGIEAALEGRKGGKKKKAKAKKGKVIDGTAL
jgi:hypothetical protein